MTRNACRPVAIAAAALALFALPAAAQSPTPKDPKSPVPDCTDGRGPIGPVELKIVSPAPDTLIPILESAAGQPPAKGAVVEVTFELKNYETFQDPKTQTGQGIALVFDNIPGFVHFDPSKPWHFRNVSKGTHTIRAFPVRPWGESIKEAGALAMVTFHVGEKDGKNRPDPKAPLLTPNRPKGKVPKGEARKVLLDFLVTGCTVADHTVADSCRVRYRVDELPEVILSKPDPVWLTELSAGKHAYVIGLTREGKIIEGPFNLYRGIFELAEPGATTPPPTSTAPAKAGSPAP